MSRSKNISPLHSLIQHRLVERNGLLVISYHCNLGQRVAATSIPDKKALQVYKTANVIPPHKKANLELAAGDNILLDFIIPSIRLRSRGSGSSVIYVCCTKLPLDSDIRLSQCNIVDVFSDPYGLSDENNSIHITDLNSIFNGILQVARNCDYEHPTIIFDSIFPLIQATQSFSEVKALLNRLQNYKSFGPTIIPVLKDVINPQITLNMMEVADANVIIEGDQFTILRRSLHGNNMKIVKEVQTYDISEIGNLIWNIDTGLKTEHLVIDEKAVDSKIQDSGDKLQQMSFNCQKSKTKGNLELKHEEVEVSQERWNRPIIFVDDDDPEFDDMDEEDPDDDLDI